MRGVKVRTGMGSRTIGEIGFGNCMIYLAMMIDDEEARVDVGAHLDLVASLELGRGGDPGGARDGALGRGDADAPACRKRGKGGRHGQWSRRAGNTCPTVTRGRLSGAPRRWIGAPATWVSDGPASARIRTGEDGRCGGECGHFTCDVRTNGVRARRVVAPRHARSYPLTGHADCVSSSGTPACARRSRFSLAENKRSC
jgi:hypothetical protein